MYVWRRVCTKNLHKLDCVWHIDDMMGDWNSISVRNWHYVLYWWLTYMCIITWRKGLGGSWWYEDGEWNCVLWHEGRGQVGVGRYEHGEWHCILYYKKRDGRKPVGKKTGYETVPMIYIVGKLFIGYD